MEAAELILVDEAPDISEGIEVMLPNLGAADSAHEFTDARVGRVAIGILGMTAHIWRLWRFFIAAHLWRRQRDSASKICTTLKSRRHPDGGLGFGGLWLW